MINGIGVLAWGVGGVEAESVLFGMPRDAAHPGGDRRAAHAAACPRAAWRPTSRLPSPSSSAASACRAQFVEFFGPGLPSLSAGDRAVVANMAPEYGASSGFFPVDEQTLAYLAATGRTRAQVDLVSAYAKRQGLWFDPALSPRYTDTIEHRPRPDRREPRRSAPAAGSSVAAPDRRGPRRPLGCAAAARPP